jgi:hypothetical protein
VNNPVGGLIGSIFKPFQGLSLPNSRRANSISPKRAVSAPSSSELNPGSFSPSLRCIREGPLSKMSREGSFDKLFFVLTKDTLSYHKDEGISHPEHPEGDDKRKHVYPLSNLISL